MTTFLRLLAEEDKGSALHSVCTAKRAGHTDPRVHQVAPEAFRTIPGAPFAYWVSETARQSFVRLSPVQRPDGSRLVCSTNPLNEDFRYVRLWWEATEVGDVIRWVPWAKGGAFSPIYYDIDTVIHWDTRVKSYYGFIGTVNRPLERPASVQHFFRPGLTWPRRTQGGFSLRVMPRGCIFADKGPAVFVEDDAAEAALALLAIANSKAFALLVSLQMAFGSYEVGVIQRTPVPDLHANDQTRIANLARRAWSLKRVLDTTEETSHAFMLPAALRERLGDYDPPAIEAELTRIQAEVDAIAFDLYDFTEADCAAVHTSPEGVVEVEGAAYSNDEEATDEDRAAPADRTNSLLSWAVGVAFGRFDWRLATGERASPTEPGPFESLPAKSPGMLPDEFGAIHAHSGILVDDAGHVHDLARLTEEVLARVDASVPSDVRRWMQRDFFAFHLQRYSKSRRKAPIYWPLSTASGSFTLWIYYPSLTNQTLYTAINDFLDGPSGKLKEIGAIVSKLRNQGPGRSRDEERQLEVLQAFELELLELRDILLNLAHAYKPNRDDGVQISAAPLWPLFRHKPWQKLLKETWAKLEKGEYDWAHLAMNYWPDRVREKCKTDKSLAIAHGLESLYAAPEVAPTKTRGKKKGAEA